MNAHSDIAVQTESGNLPVSAANHKSDAAPAIEPTSQAPQAPKGRNMPAQGKALGRISQDTLSCEPERSGDRSPTGDPAGVIDRNQRKKETGILRDGWRIAPFAEVVDILDSRRIPVSSEERAKRVGDVPYFGATGQVGVIDKHIFDEELVLLGEDGAPFLDSAKPKAYLISGKSWVNNHAHVLRGKPGLLNGFLLYQLNNLDYRPYISGTTRLKLPQGPMKQIPLLVPPLPEQLRIVAEIEKQFTRLEAGVAALRRVQANLKRYRAAVLKAACEGKLVPTEAELRKAEGRRMKDESTSSFFLPPSTFESGEALLQRILAERRKNWTGRGKYKEPGAPDTTNLPPLPEGWTWATVEQLAALEQNSITDGPFGSNLKTEHYTDSGPRVIRLQNIGDGVYVDEEAHITQEHFEQLQKHRIFSGDVVIAGFGENPPRSCIIPESLGPAIVKADCIRFKPHSSVLPKYTNVALNSDPVRKRTKAMVHGVGRPRLNLGEIKSIALSLPPLGEQTRIVAEVERRLSVVEELESVVTANLQRASRLRQSILQKAFRGELCVR